MSGGGRYNQMIVNERFQPRKLAVETITADTTLTANDSGKIIFVGKTGVDITMPSVPEAGLNYTFILNEDNATTVCKVTWHGSGEFLAGSLSTAADGTAHSGIFDGSADDVVSFATGAKQGDMFTTGWDGTTWYVWGQSTAATAITSETS